MVYDLIDYHLRECIKREVKMRVCKNCGRYFSITGRANTGYCNRPFDSRGRTCKEVGAGDSITVQTPAGGAVIPGKSTVILYAGAEKPNTMYTVPQLVGKTAAEANVAATNAGLLVRFSGATQTTSGNIRVLSQSLEAGQQVPAGTVITVQLGDANMTD